MKTLGIIAGTLLLVVVIFGVLVAIAIIELMVMMAIEKKKLNKTTK